MSEFDELVESFDNLVAKSTSLSGADLRAARKEQAKVERLIADLAEKGMLGYNDAYARCRDMGHTWQVTYNEWEENELVRLSTCDGCGSERLDHISRTGALKYRRYTYSEGFLLDGSDEELAELGAGTRHRRYWRAANVQRAIKS